MPVDGTYRAAMPRTCGSCSRIPAWSSSWFSTPLASPRRLSSAIRGSSSGSVATTSLPVTSCGRAWAVGARSRTAASESASTESDPVTTAAASSPGAPLDTAAATAACSAVSVSDGSATVAAAYVRPSVSRTAAPSAAPVRARADRASVTIFASSGSPWSGIAFLPLVGVFRRVLVRSRPLDGLDQHRVDPHPPAGVLAALGQQPQARHLGLRPRQRHAAELLGEQPTDRVDVGRGQHLAEIILLPCRAVGAAEELHEVLH